MNTTATKTAPPRKDATNTIHNLPVYSPEEAARNGFVSITNGCNRNTEDDIMKSMASHRNPERFCWIRFFGCIYELGRKIEDAPIND